MTAEDEDREYLEHMARQRAEADAFLADPAVATPRPEDDDEDG